MLKRSIVLMSITLLLSVGMLSFADTITLETTCKIDSQWSGGYQATITLKNTSKTNTARWNGKFFLPTGQTLDNIWGASHVTQEKTDLGTTVYAKNPDYQEGGVIPAGGSTDIGFTASTQNHPEIQDVVFTAETQTPPAPPIPGPGFNTHVFAPYVDVMLYPTFSLQDSFEKNGQPYYTLAFITANAEGKPTWGGITPIDDYYFADQITYIRQHKGDVIVSFGGANGTALAGAIRDPEVLAKTYEDIIEDYKLTWVDFDVEGQWVADPDSIDRRNKALVIVEKNHPEVTIAYCLPILTSGLTKDGLHVLDNALENGVRIDHVNAMTMDFGDTSAPHPDHNMGNYIIDAANNLHQQLNDLYKQHGMQKSDAELWHMIGITPMLGQNDVESEVVWQMDAEQVEKFATNKGVGMLAMWSSNRDNGDKRDPYASPSHSGIKQNLFEFTNIFKPFIQ